MTEHQGAIQSVLNSTRQSVDWIGAREVFEKGVFCSVKDSKIEAHHEGESRGIYFEALVQGQLGYAATSSFSESSLKSAAERAVSKAKQAAAYALVLLPTSVRPPVRGEFRSPVRTPWSTLRREDVFSKMCEATEGMKVSEKICRRGCRVQALEVESWMWSSNGSSVYQHQHLISSHLEAVAQDGALVQRRTDGGFSARSRQGGIEFWLDTPLTDRAQRIAEDAVALLNAEECPTAVMDLLLMPDQMMLQIHESIGHPLELDRILGDERNYAGWSFVKLDDFGKLKYGSELMNVTFDPTVESEFASYSFDEIGNAATREYIIQKGILKRGLGSLESQVRTGLPGVANQRASSWNRPAIDRMANLNLEPGTSRLEEMISQMTDGVIMDSNRSWSIDDRRNKFQFGCERGQRVKNGKIVGLVRNPNYRGATIPFWNSLKAVGNSSTREIFGSPYCGKGEPNQIIRVGHASPPCLFSQVEVFGGGRI